MRRELVAWLLVLGLGSLSGYLAYRLGGESVPQPCPEGVRVVTTREVRPGPQGEQVVVETTDRMVYTGIQDRPSKRDEWSVGVRVAGDTESNRAYGFDVGMQLADLPAELTLGVDWKPSTNTVSPVLGVRVSF